MANRLEKEFSPYLRAHRNDPVNWYPWCEEAFEKAGQENKPVFLSVGYSACHWCHVMAEESFRDAEVAEILNRSFVSVKVDREERSDIDSVYMRFCIALNGSGGWPMTVLMTPEQQPFFAGTYLPRDDRYGRMGLVSLLLAVERKWHDDGSELVKVAADLTTQLSSAAPVSSAEPSGEFITAAAEQLRASYDEEYGGFGTAPKFPAPHNLIFLMRTAALKGDKGLRSMVDNTLRQMYRGGIYDHIGGGFCRYSTDREWLAPHFEKMLYDNALLAFCYTEAWQDGHTALYRSVAENTLDYCLRELKSPDGGFFCSQDADSSGGEGAYYLFTEDEVKSVLGEDHGRHFCQCYDITPEGNFMGKNIPNLLLNTRWNFLPEGYGEFCEKLRLYREERMSLAIDDKILTSWNGLMLMALSRAAAAFGDRRYLMEAGELADFLHRSMVENGALYSVRCGNVLHHPATLEDLAFYALGLLELYRADFDVSHIAAAEELAEEILRHFADKDGGFYSTSQDAERLILRPKEVTDGAMPSGNSAAAVLFDALAHYTGKKKWIDAAYSQLRFLCGSTGSYPAGCTFGFTALLSSVYPAKEIVFALTGTELPASGRAALARYAPELTFLVKTPESAELLSKLAPHTAGMSPADGKAACYVCSGGVCSPPVALE